MSIVAVSFQRTVTLLEPWPGGTDWWSAEDPITKDWGITCAEKGNALIFEWTSRAAKTRGKTKRVRIPLTNIAGVLEVLEDAPKEKP